ncbi:PREDICTED: zinc finger protein 2 homolog [Bactrocera latifrons]|uniref:Protein hunchback n=2 Tax=Bactrocera latifrons TaxID=174628 RepID=A0A0K8WEJ9_BACLA|nr:PREDICTED: zinc finger protein 2 homolog [Bactrocera latifrons]
MNFQTSCCRICLKSELLMSIYLYSSTFPLRPIEIVEKLNIFKYDETLPTLLCQSCLYRLLDAYNLQQLAEASERRLREYIGNGTASGSLGICGISTNTINQDSSCFSSTAPIADACKDVSGTSAIYSNICDMFERSTIQTNNEVINDKVCAVAGEDMLNDIEIDVSSLTRSEANEDTLNEVFAIKHAQLSLNREINLKPDFTGDLAISPPIKANIDLPLNEKRSECSKHYENSKPVEITKLQSREKTFLCKQCPRQFKQSSNLHIHQRTHTGEKRFQCEICANFFTTSSNLKAHKATHLEQREYLCGQCNRDFKTLRELRRHEPVHKTVKDNVCGKCQKAFTKRSYLMEHISAMHRDIRRHKCADCGKFFGRRSNLVSHIRIHSGEKPFQCEFCEWKFNQSSTLARHMKKHSSKNKNLNFNIKSTELKKSTLVDILQSPEAIAQDVVDMDDIGINAQSNFNVLNNLSSLSDIHCMSNDGLNTELESTSITEPTDEKEAIQNNGGYEFTKNDILDFSTNHVVC